MLTAAPRSPGWSSRSSITAWVQPIRSVPNPPPSPLRCPSASTRGHRQVVSNSQPCPDPMRSHQSGKYPLLLPLLLRLTASAEVIPRVRQSGLRSLPRSRSSSSPRQLCVTAPLATNVSALLLLPTAATSIARASVMLTAAPEVKSETVQISSRSSSLPRSPKIQPIRSFPTRSQNSVTAAVRQRSTLWSPSGSDPPQPYPDPTRSHQSGLPAVASTLLRLTAPA